MQPAPIDQISGREFLSGLFSLVMGAADVVEDVQKGVDPLVAMKRASKKAKRRRAALRQAEIEAVEEVDGEEKKEK